MLKNKYLLLLLFFLAFKAEGQDSTALKYASGITVEGARLHLSILASDKFEGRETGKRGAKLAASYLAGQFKNLGLTAPVNGSYFQKVGLVESGLQVRKFEVNNKELKHLSDFYMAKATSSKKIKASQVVFVGYGISTERYDDLKGMDIAGKVVMVLSDGEPQRDGTSLITGSKEVSEWSRRASMRIENIRSKNPALIISVNANLAKYLEENKDHLGAPTVSLMAENQKAISADVIHVTLPTAELLVSNTGKGLKSLTAEISRTAAPVSQTLAANLKISYKDKRKEVPAANVLGYLEGGDLKDELLVISAHYDHIGLNPHGTDKVYNGADDDGSGTSAVLELAKAFIAAKQAGSGPRRSILFLLVVGEEKGLLGSQWYSDYPVFPLANTVTNLNIDMIGRVDPAHKDNPDYCYLIGSDKLSTQLHKISEQANATYTNLTIDYKYNDPKDPERIYYRSDHYNFAKHGIPIIFYFNGVHEDYHKASDEIEKIDFPLLVRRAKLIFHTAWEIVNRDQRPVVDVTNNMPQSR
jgi:hypothetical protein